MSIVRVTKDKNYFHASNEPFNDPAMSWGARGIMGYLLSKPDGWEVRNYDLYRKSPDGRRKVNGYLGELKKAGYLRRYKVYKPAMVGRGRIEWVTEIYERKEMNPDNVRCIQNVTVEDVNVKSVNVEESGDIDITESAITNPIITKESKPSPPGKTNGTKPTKEPLADILEYANKGVSEDTAPNPQDVYWQHRDPALRVAQVNLGQFNQVEKSDILALVALPDFEPPRWELAVMDTARHYKGQGKVARAIEMYHAGGSYEAWRRKTYEQETPIKPTEKLSFGAV